MKILEVDTATCVIAALEDEVTDRLATGIRGRGVEETHKLFFTFYGGECVDQRASIGLHGRRYLPCTAKVGGTERDRDE